MAALAGLFLLFLLGFAFVATLIICRNESEVEKRKLIKAWLIIIGGIISIPLLLYILSPFWTPMTTSQSDNYGTYIIDREMFKGKQADWQYNHYRFEIKEDNSFLFHVTNKEKILQTYVGNVIFIAPRGKSICVYVIVNEHSHHILQYAPTMYRETWSFYYVFHSKHYGNMFFRKGEWEEIDD